MVFTTSSPSRKVKAPMRKGRKRNEDRGAGTVRHLNIQGNKGKKGGVVLSENAFRTHSVRGTLGREGEKEKNGIWWQKEPLGHRPRGAGGGRGEERKGRGRCGYLPFNMSDSTRRTGENGGVNSS